MRPKRLFVCLAGAAALIGAGGAYAQVGTVARLSNLEGGVMVSQGDGMVAAVNDQRVAPGTRVITLAGGKVVINYDVGCDISLKENQRFNVRLGECGLLLGSVVTLAPVVGTTAGVAGLSAVGAATTVGFVGGLGYGVYETFRNNPSSPN